MSDMDGIAKAARKACGCWECGNRDGEHPRGSCTANSLIEAYGRIEAARNAVTHMPVRTKEDEADHLTRLADRVTPPGQWTRREAEMCTCGHPRSYHFPSVGCIECGHNDVDGQCRCFTLLEPQE